MTLGYSSDRTLIQCEILHSLGTTGDISTGLFGKIRRSGKLLISYPLTERKGGWGKMMKENEIKG